ncbi:ABC transporter ATP-binding protein/permease [Pelagibacteraceae bacterium]|nr:ABC transporter ATP-binding protein/permease [Pelagibacteraceae bacterium]
MFSFKKIKIFLSKKQLKLSFLLFLGMLCVAALEMIGVGSIPVFLNLLLDPEKLISYLPGNNFVDSFSKKDFLYQILFSAVVLLIFFTLKNLFIFFINYLQTLFFRNVCVENSKRLFESYLNSPYSLHLNRNPAIINRNIVGEVRAACSYVEGFINIFREIFIIFFILTLLLLVNPFTSFAVFLGIGSFAIIFYYSIRKKMAHLSEVAQYNRGRQVQLINQVFGAIKDTKILAKESYFINEFKNQTRGAENAVFFTKLINKTSRLFFEIIGILIILAFTLLFVTDGRSMESMIPILGLLGFATIRLIPSFNQITSTSAIMRNNLISFDIVISELEKLEKYNLKDDDPKILNINQTNKPTNLNIEIKNITYEYPNSEKSSLNNISFKITSGSFIGIIGETGSGKSTLIDVILGLLEPTKGEIVVDGNNINKNFPLWQSHIGYIPQDIYLTDDTIKRNIAFGIPDNDIDNKKVQSSIKLAQLDKFISSLPSGADTFVGNRGIRLSGGQRQRIGIARALYRKSKILVLDEATSSLDFETEKRLIDDIERLSGDYTLIMVTHRLPTIKNCDEVIFLSEGKLVDQGKFDSLISRNDKLFKNNLGKKGI